jgi:fumarate hydratase class II
MGGMHRLMLVKCLNPKIRYDIAIKVAKECAQEKPNAQGVNRELKALSEENFDQLVRPGLMVGPEEHKGK